MIYRSRWIIPVTVDPIENGEVLVRGDRIAGVGIGLSVLYPDEPVTDLGNAALFPGFINAHSHLDYTIARGKVNDLPLSQWVLKLGCYADLMNDEDFYWSSMLGLAEGIAAGYTTFADASYSGQPLRAMTDVEACGISYREVFAFRPHHVLDEAVDALIRQIEEMHEYAGPNVAVGVSPHSPYLARPELLRRVRRLADDEKLPVSLHVAESEEETRFVREFTGPYAMLAQMGGWEIEGRWSSPVEYLDGLGFLAPDVQCVHCVHVNGEDIELLKKRGASIAHCPKSNAKLGNGVAPVTDMLANGLPVGLGTDSTVSNNILSPFEEMRFAADLQRARCRDPLALTAGKALEMATVDAAASIGLAGETGSIGVGMRADLAAVSLDSLVFQPDSDVVAGIVFSASASDVILTVAAGKELYRFGEHLTLDKDEVINWARKSIARLEQQA